MFTTFHISYRTFTEFINKSDGAKKKEIEDWIWPDQDNDYQYQENKLTSTKTKIHSANLMKEIPIQ